MKVRKLNSDGLKKFEEFIERLRSGAEQNTPFYLLDDNSTSEELAPEINVDQAIEFASRYDLGNYLCDVFKGLEIQPLIGDSGFWSWFALLWFDQLCPSKKGVRNPSKAYNYILSRNYNHRPRHSIYMTWQLVDRYAEEVRFMLGKHPAIRGEITEQMMARQDFLSMMGVMRLASRLYYDPETGSFKKGAASRKSAGCVYRYIGLLQQLQLTFDISSTTCDDLHELLPSEFGRFLENTAS